MTGRAAAAVLVVVACLTGAASGAVPKAESDALKKLYQATWPGIVEACCKKTPPKCNNIKCTYNKPANWMLGDPCDDKWAGVRCSGCPVACTVTGLDMDDNDMRGKFPNGVLAGLPNLEQLILDHNQMTGTFPDEIENTPKLYDLRLGGSHNGPLPNYETKHPETFKKLYFHGPFNMANMPDFAPLTALEEYSLLSTQVSGSLPKFDTLTMMRDFRIRDNQRLTGTMPDFVSGPTGQFTRMERLEIHNNNGLTGTIPDFTDMTGVQILQVDDQESVSGTVPPLNTLTRLTYFDLSDNRLTGQVPTFSPLASATLEKIRLEENYLFGMDLLDAKPGVMNALTELIYDYNLMTGTLPCHQTTFPSLQYLRGDFNRLTGTLPCLDKLLVIEEYSLTNNDFSGTLPDITAAPGIKIFKLDCNILTGTIAQGFVNSMVQAEQLWLGANGFTGTLPDISALSDLDILHVHRNVGWTKMDPVAITSLGAMDADLELKAARDGNPLTEWKCLPGSGDVCNIMVDFGKPVCLENLRIQESPTRSPLRSTFLQTREGVDGCPLSINVYQGGTGFAKSSVAEPMLWRQVDKDSGRSGRHGYNYNSCSPGSWRNIGRERWTNHESWCGESSHGEGGGWDPYCRDRTRYYRIQIRRCSQAPCRIAEIEFWGGGERLSGEIPQLPAEIDTFWGYGNQFTGAVPLAGPEWGTDLLLSDNWLSTQLPDFCPHLAAIDRLWLDHNRITGTMPAQTCLSQVVTLRMGHNLLTGTIPECPCGRLEEYYLDGNACCQNPTLEPGHQSWRDQELTKSRSIGHMTVCPRFDMFTCSSGGLTGRLPDFTKYPRLQRFGVDNNYLRGPVDSSVRDLTLMQWFRVRHNNIAGTLPYASVIEAGNRSDNCAVQSWYFTNNTMWGPVPDLPMPLGTCTGPWTCFYSGTRRGRKIWDFEIDHNRLWGPTPSRFERVRADAVVNHNCWDCPTTEQAVWGPPLNPDESMLSGRSNGYGQVKELTRPPDCGEGPNYAQRYELDGPSCPAEPPNSLYEHVDRCRPEIVVNRTFTEEEIRKGGLSFSITFAEDSPLPFWAPGLWRCLLCEDAQGTKSDCSMAPCPFGPLDAVTSKPTCPVDPVAGGCPADVPLIVWPTPLSPTCPIGVNASCPEGVCLPCPTGVTPNATDPCRVTPGMCGQTLPCELNSVCPFGPNGSSYDGLPSGCMLTTMVMHAPNGTCRINPTNGSCPAGDCNYPWSCDADVQAKGTPWGPLPIDFSMALRKLFYDGMNTTSVQKHQTYERGYRMWKEKILKLMSFELGPIPGSDQYVDLPTEMIVHLSPAIGYDTSVTEPIGVTVWDELVLAPFGALKQPAGHWYIVPSPGLMNGADVNVSEDVTRGRDGDGDPVPGSLKVKVNLPWMFEEGGWETWRCGANYTPSCVEFRTVRPGPNASRVCGFECAIDTPDAGLLPNISVTYCDEYTMEFNIALPSYNLADNSTELVEMSFNGDCTASGIPPKNNTILINIWSLVDPVPTPTVTVTPPRTRTVSFSASESANITATLSVTPTQTNVPYCVVFPDSLFCNESSLNPALPWLAMLLLTLIGCAAVALGWKLFPKKKQRVHCRLDEAVVGVVKPPEPEPSISVNVRGVPADDPPPVTITGKRVPHADPDESPAVVPPSDRDIMVGVTPLPPPDDKVTVTGKRVDSLPSSHFSPSEAPRTAAPSLLMGLLGAGAPAPKLSDIMKKTDGDAADEAQTRRSSGSSSAGGMSLLRSTGRSAGSVRRPSRSAYSPSMSAASDVGDGKVLL